MAPRPLEDDGLSVDQVEVIRGVADRGRDPAVVALLLAEDGMCSGALVAPDVVLTARHCVARTVETVTCPAPGPQVGAQRAPASLRVVVGDDVALGREAARGRAILTPSGSTLCDADIALVVLDTAIPDIAPLPVREHGVAKGDHVRAVGFGRIGDDGPAGTKLLRDHVPVLETSPDEFMVGESTCSGDSGGPALDEKTGAIVGVVSRGGPTCEGRAAHNIYTRTDVFRTLIQAAIARSPFPYEPPQPVHEDAGLYDIPDGGKKTKPPKPGPPITDMGGACQVGADCSSGVCVRDAGRRYCSRTCGTGDRCPSHYNCRTATGGTRVCVAK